MRREDVPNTIWQRHDSLSNGGMSLLIWSTTNPRCGMAGCYQVPRRQLVEGRLSDDELATALDETERAGLILYRDQILWRRDRVAQLHTRSIQIAKSIGTDLLDLVGTVIYRAFVDEYAKPEHWLLETLADADKQGRWETIVTDLSERRARLVRGSGEAHDHRFESEVGEPHPGFHGQGQGQGDCLRRDDVKDSLGVEGEDRADRAGLREMA